MTLPYFSQKHLLAEIKEDVPKPTTDNEIVKSQIASLRLHFTETAQDLAESQLTSNGNRDSVQTRGISEDEINYMICKPSGFFGRIVKKI